MVELGELSVEFELVLLEGSNEQCEKLSPEHSAQEPHGQEKPVATVDPAFAVGTDAAARNDAVQVGVGEKVLSPGVQKSEASDLGAEMLRVSGERQEGLGSGAKQDPVDGAAILECQRGELVRKRENDVEVLDVEHLLLTGLKPRGTCSALTLRAMPVTAGVVDADDVATAVAHLGVTTEGGSPALDEVGQDTTLFLGWTVPFQKSRTVLADDIGHFGPMLAHFFAVLSLS
jgi:hypothetical protein